MKLFFCCLTVLFMLSSHSMASNPSPVEGAVFVATLTAGAIVIISGIARLTGFSRSGSLALGGVTTALITGLFAGALMASFPSPHF